MAITTSASTTDASGWTIETHTDSTGAQHQVCYRWDGVADRDVLMTAHAAQITEQLAEAEASAQIEVI